MAATDVAPITTSEAWPERITISIWMVQEKDHWVALVADFNVAGMGRTESDAFQNLSENLNAYLAAFRAEGATLEDARRPISKREELRLRLSQVASVAEAWRRRKVRHSHYDVSPRTDGVAFC
jgi:predicted RNase H-like HicB family nuclease